MNNITEISFSIHSSPCSSNITRHCDTDKNTPGSHWSPSPPHSKLRHQDFGSGWPVRYARGVTGKNKKKLNTWLQLYLRISQHHFKRGQKKTCVYRTSSILKEVGQHHVPSEKYYSDIMWQQHSYWWHQLHFVPVVNMCERALHSQFFFFSRLYL